MNDVLIVEDSKLFSGLISKKISAEFSLNCIVKSSYHEAVSELEENAEQFQLAVLDLNLPDAPDGEIVNYVTSKNIPAIVMTSQLNDAVRDKILSFKLIDYLVKGPQSMEVLANTIRRFFHNKNFHILLVDDSKFARELTRDLLVSQYFRVSEATNGAEALKCLEKNSSIKLLLTDYHMPEMNGFELTTEVRTKYSMEDLAIIGISARGNPLLASQFLKCGANDFLSKPYFEEELIWRINQNVEMLDLMSRKRSYQNKLEQEVQEQTAKIKESQKMILQQEKLAAIGQLAAGVVHEINNPIGFIASNLGTLQKYIEKLMEYINASLTGVGPEELLELQKKLKIDFIAEDIRSLAIESNEGVERVKEIINNLKNYSRTSDAKATEANINEGLESTIKIIWNELKYKVKLVKEYGDLPLIKCFPQQLNQVFMNFLVNASQAIEKEGVVTIKTWLEGKDVLVSIADTGHGISAENINRLFEPFFTTKEIGKGTGLGLSIAQEIIQKHNGKIDVESEVGRGTNFTVSIPVAGTP